MLQIISYKIISRTSYQFLLCHYYVIYELNIYKCVNFNIYIIYHCYVTVMYNVNISVV